MWIRAANVGNEDACVKSRTMIGTVFKCEIKSERSDIGFNHVHVGNTKEVFIQHFEVSEMTAPISEFELPDDIFPVSRTIRLSHSSTDAFHSPSLRK